MNRISFVLIISVLLTVPVFAESALPEQEEMFPAFRFAQYFGVEDTNIPTGIRNNRFYLESLRLNKLAQDAFDDGHYDASAGFAEEAVRYALLSDEYVAEQLIVETDRLLTWADNNNIPAKFPNNYEESRNYHDSSIIAHSNEDWYESIDFSVKAIGILAAFQSGSTPPAATTTTTPAASSGLPRQYTVRTWIVEKDCLWNIAAYPWVYGDPWKWTELYNANKSKLPDPNNPNLIEPGMVLDIPSLSGEPRQGVWRPGSTTTTTNTTTAATTTETTTSSNAAPSDDNTSSSVTPSNNMVVPANR